MIEIHIDLQRLKALQLLAGKNDVRYYMNGVCVEATKDETRLLATQGHVAGFMRHCNPPSMLNAVSEGYAEFIIPNECIDKVKLSKSVSNIGTVLIESGRKASDGSVYPSTYTLRLWDGTLMPFQPCEGKFPDLRRILPAEVTHAAANFDPKYIEAFRKVATALGVSKHIGGVLLQFNGEAGPSRVILHAQADFAGLIMPLRDKNDALKDTKPVMLPPRGAEAQADDAQEVAA